MSRVFRLAADTVLLIDEVLKSVFSDSYSYLTHLIEG